MRKISLDNIQALFAKISGEMALYLPVDKNDGKAEYERWEEGTVWSDALTTRKSPKDFFFPQSEDLMRFRTEGKTIEITDVREESKPFA
ncbi:MAG: 4Fe-4S ferredoxin, partial [Clostridia bacterium]|nr:4Fe-4S ferredoxin [Clostridia bacterium]